MMARATKKDATAAWKRIGIPPVQQAFLVRSARPAGANFFVRSCLSALYGQCSVDAFVAGSLPEGTTANPSALAAGTAKYAVPSPPPSGVNAPRFIWPPPPLSRTAD